MEEALLKELKEEVRLLREEVRLLRVKMHVSETHLTEIQFNSEKNKPPQLQEHDLDPNSILNFLHSKKIAIKNYRENLNDDIFLKLSNYLGSRFTHLKDLYSTIKPSLSSGGSFYYNMQNKPQDVIAYSTQFCSMLHQNAFLSTYNYKKAAKSITGTPQRIGQVINFFTGAWLENYIMNFLLKCLETKGIDNFSFVQNCQIELQNGDDFELDMVFVINGIPLWIECKTGDYQRYITKYSDFRKKLGTEVQNSILIISDLPEGLSKNLSSTFQLTVVDLEEGKNYIQNLIEKI